MPDASDRIKLINEKVRLMQDAERHQVDAVRQGMLEFLARHKGYLADDIEKDPKFRVRVGGCEEDTSTDFIIRLGGRRFMAVQCAAASVDSRIRHIVAFSRVVDEHQIPLALVTDGENTRLIDTLTGKVISEDLQAVPSRQESLELMERTDFTPCPPGRLEGERRILLAFDSVRCRPE